MLSIIQKKIRKIRDFYTIYTSGLDTNEIEHLLKKDTIDAFSYLKRKAHLSQKPQTNSIKKFLLVAKEIFLCFVMQLSPARRLVYGIGAIILILGLLTKDLIYLVSSVLILNFLLALELVDKLTTRDELQIAREIQISLQPDHIPTSDFLSFSTYSEPARVVGGDFFDIIQLAENRIITIVGDVADKGISAALYAAFTQSMFQSLSETKKSPSQIMISLNDLISKRLREGDFITIAIALFDLNDKSVTLSRAGHNWPLFYSSETRQINELKPKGPSIGIVGNPDFADQLEEQKIHLKKGDFMLLYTDGITEAYNSKKQMFDVPNLKTAIEKSVHESSKEIVNHITLQLNTFTESSELQDDATMIAVKMT
jgi:serine phosphatase RsbU (regulator of sigma subunit)